MSFPQYDYTIKVRTQRWYPSWDGDGDGTEAQKAIEKAETHYRVVAKATEHVTGLRVEFISRAIPDESPCPADIAEIMHNITDGMIRFERTRWAEKVKAELEAEGVE